MPNDEQPTAAAFARMQEQMEGMARDIAEIKQDLRERGTSGAARIDSLVEALSRERQARAEEDARLLMQMQAQAATLRAERVERTNEISCELDALKLRFKWTTGAIVAVSAAIQWGIGMALRFYGH